jgi:FtsH-binding integral membrane protein
MGDAIRDALELFVDLIGIFVRILAILLKNTEKREQEKRRPNKRR